MVSGDKSYVVFEGAEVVAEFETSEDQGASVDLLMHVYAGGYCEDSNQRHPAVDNPCCEAAAVVAAGEGGQLGDVNAAAVELYWMQIHILLVYEELEYHLYGQKCQN